MLLIFGGTTEGKKAVRVCDEAGQTFYYATKTKTQQIKSVYATHLYGAKESSDIVEFCQKNSIKLIINAAHPFAENLHENISKASLELEIPVLRYERNYSENEELVWFDSYKQASDFLLQKKYKNILALTGVNTIAKLKPLWKQTPCWFRILDRKESRAIAENEGFCSEKLLFYDATENQQSLFSKLKPEAILTKESGDTGGFPEKIAAAKALNIPIFVIKRPLLAPHFISVYGEYSLRKAIENYCPPFFKLKTGYTTGSCATAATKAALTALLTKEKPSQVSITLPNGDWVVLPIAAYQKKENEASATVIKDAGDDPDVTDGARIIATVKLNSTHKGTQFLQGKGVGRVTLPGVGLPIGSPAINKTPKAMIKREIFKVFRHYQEMLPPSGMKTGVDVTISVPEGEKLALQTYNPKIGIVEGISIIGSSGIVKPFSSEAFIIAIHREMQVAKALECKHIVINSGAKSEVFLKKQFPNFIEQAFIHYGNFIGETLKMAEKLAFHEVSLGIMIGKAVKLAEGFLDTHSKKVVMNKDFLLGLATESKCSENTMEEIKKMTMARQLWSFVPREEFHFFQAITDCCQNVCNKYFTKGKLNILLLDDSGNIICKQNTK